MAAGCTNQPGASGPYGYVRRMRPQVGWVRGRKALKGFVFGIGEKHGRWQEELWGGEGGLHPAVGILV